MLSVEVVMGQSNAADLQPKNRPKKTKKYFTADGCGLGNKPSKDKPALPGSA
jgi:hypothetical protein